jgi:hypothetical protein
MLNIIRRSVAVVTIVVGGFLLSGCAVLVAGGAAGVGTVAYIKGELSDRLDASTDQTREAIERAVEELELQELKSDADGLSGDYILETGRDEKINVRYEKLGDRSTQISIRVGLFGDENLSRALLEEIKKGL